MTSLNLKGKVAIVTGAGGGIGREIALALASEGVKILVNDVGVSLSGEGSSLLPAEETCGLIIQKGGQAISDNNSVSSWASAKKIIENALDHFKKIDIVINVPTLPRPTLLVAHRVHWRIENLVHNNPFFFFFLKPSS